jgi:hypothetical protein
MKITFTQFIAIVLLNCAWISESSATEKNPFLGRWDIDVQSIPGPGKKLTRYCWLELKLENDTLKGRLQPGEGATLGITEIKIENGILFFKQGDSDWKGEIKGKQILGSVKSPIFGTETCSWTGVRAPVWPAKLPEKKPGNPVSLIGNDVSGWLVQKSGIPIGWSVKDGILMNEGKEANNIYSKQKFQDFTLMAEFKIDPKSNSGIYLRGRYEIQVMDGYGLPLNVHSMGALYGYTIPPVNACKPASEWQTYELTIIANHVTIILNGQKLTDNIAIPGLTGGALDANEGLPGPIMIQGDHGKVQYRKLIVTPLI